MNLLTYTIFSAIMIISATSFLTKKYNDKLPKNKFTDVLNFISSNYLESLVVIITLFVASLYSGQSILNGMLQQLLKGLASIVMPSCTHDTSNIIFMRNLPRGLM